MKYTVKEIADLINAEIIGDADRQIVFPSTLENAERSHIASLHNKKYLPQLESTQAGAVIISEELKPEQPPKNVTLLVVKEAYSAFAKVMSSFARKEKKNGISENVVIGENCQVADDCYIGHGVIVGSGSVISSGCQIHPNCTIGENVVIGSDAELFSGVNIYSNCKIGNKVMIHSGAVIGSEGFGFAPNDQGEICKVPQLGYVLIEDEVEIGANTTIDRGTLGPTKIGKGTKLDNLIQVGHNVEIGPYTIIAAQTGISGSTKLGHHCMIGGQVGFVGHLSIAPYTQINAQSGVSKSVKKEHQKLHGAPAFEFGDAMKSYVVYKQLPQLRRKVEELEEMLSLLRKNE